MLIVVPTLFFRWLFLHEQWGLEVQNFLTFPNSLQRMQAHCSHRTQAPFKSPALLGLIFNSNFACKYQPSKI